MKITSTGTRRERRTRYGHNLAQVGMGAQQVACAAKAPAWLGGSRRFYGFWCGYLKTKASRVTVEHDRRTWEGPAWNVVVGERAVHRTAGSGCRRGRSRATASLDALVFTGPRSGAYTQLPRLFRHGDHVPDPHIQELKAKIRFEVRSERPMPVLADGVALGTTPATFQIVPRPILLQAMRRPHLDRIRASGARRPSSRGLDAARGVSVARPRVPHRATTRCPWSVRRCSCSGPDRDPVLLVPELERPLAAASPVGEHLELVPWRDGADPYEAAASLLTGAARVAVGGSALGLPPDRPAAGAARRRRSRRRPRSSAGSGA